MSEQGSSSLATGRDEPAPVERISIVVLTYNRRALLQRCLTSLLQQDYPRDAMEIIVSDDGSTDGTGAMVEEMASRDARIVYAPQPHRGIPAARNNGLARATAPIVAFVADDYVFRPDYVATATGFLRDHPEASIIRFRIVPSEDHFGARVSHCFYDVSIRKRLLLGSSPDRRPSLAGLLLFVRRLPDLPEGVTSDHALEAAGAAAFRREVFDRVGLFDEKLLRTEDTDLTQRLHASGIAVHYDPRHTVGHHYERLPFDTLRKCYLTGLHRAELVRKRASSERAGGGDLRAKVSGLLDAVLRARNAGSGASFVAYLPVMLLFELADAAGYVSGRLGLARRRGAGA